MSPFQPTDGCIVNEISGLQPSTGLNFIAHYMNKLLKSLC